MIPYQRWAEITSPLLYKLDTHSAQFGEFAEFLIEIWAWNIARAKHATQAGGKRLGERLSVTLAAEKEQGMSGSLVTSKPTRLRRTTRVCTAVLGMRCFLSLSCLVLENIQLNMHVQKSLSPFIIMAESIPKVTLRGFANKMSFK